MFIALNIKALKKIFVFIFENRFKNIHIKKIQQNPYSLNFLYSIQVQIYAAINEHLGLYCLKIQLNCLFGNNLGIVSLI